MCIGDGACERKLRRVERTRSRERESVIMQAGVRKRECELCVGVCMCGSVCIGLCVYICIGLCVYTYL